MIPVVDLFAGPGGLGEGFCSYKNHKIFNIVLSVEKEKFACETLILRSFFHQFKKKPNDYYDYLKGKIDKDILFRNFPSEYKKAQDIVMNLEMGVGNNNDKVSKISIVGAGMVSTPGVTYRMFRGLADEKINILVISTSEIKLSVIIDENDTLKAVKKLHTIFDLD